MKKYIEPVKIVQEEMDKLSYVDLWSIFNMSSMISEERYHPDYRIYHQSVKEAFRIELDKRLQAITNTIITH